MTRGPARRRPLRLFDRWKAKSIDSAGLSTAGQQPKPSAKPEHPAQEHIYTRPSHGLQQFFSAVSDFKGFPILDLAGASQANITVITGLGFRLYSDDVIRTLEMAFGRGSDYLANQSDPAKVQQFIDSTLHFEPSHFCGALLWDTLQFLTSPLLQDTVDQLYDILMPGAYMLAFFHSNERVPSVPVYSYRIAADARSIVLATRGEHRAAPYLNNRAIEKLFHKFTSMKFFLTREHLREIIVRR